ncbi:uncharacterized protein LOC117567344 [Drosophila albomicans]|uniref:Uncharacterized protein LOC117567344 n=1 Tax=Drosophila albomicans TaxID=7291 RepID=A0A9C6W5L1_DROAB|nr:uncharacterized protein LOC117567344 [Drosophila albomicans]
MYTAETNEMHESIEDNANNNEKIKKVKKERKKKENRGIDEDHLEVERLDLSPHFSNKPIKILLPECPVSAEILSLANDWMVNVSIECPRNSIFDLMQVAYNFYMPRLRIDLLSCLDDRSAFSTEDIVHLYFRAQKTRVADVSILMLHAVGQHFLLIVHTDEFRDLEWHALRDLLHSSLLYVHSEIEVLYSVFIWLYTAYDDRINDLAGVLEGVRFQQMPPVFLVTLGTLLTELDVELADKLCPNMQMGMLIQQECYQCDIEVGNGVELERVWIEDPECPYLNDVKKGKYIDHEVFLKYVERLTNLDAFTSRIYVKSNKNVLQLTEISQSE